MHDGVTLAVGSMRGKIYVYDLRKTAEPLRSITAHKSSIQSLHFQYDRSKLVSLQLLLILIESCYRCSCASLLQSSTSQSSASKSRHFNNNNVDVAPKRASSKLNGSRGAASTSIPTPQFHSGSNLRFALFLFTESFVI